MGDRKRDLAAIHVAKKALGLDDDVYREIVFQTEGVRSAKDLSDAGRRALLDRFRGMGHAPVVPESRRRKNAAATPAQSKIRYLWRDLYRAGLVKDRSDAALDSYIRRMTNKDALRFLRRDEEFRVIEAMKLWLARAA